MDSLATKIFQNLGLTGNGIAGGSIIPTNSNPFSQDRELTDFREAGEVSSAELWNNYSQALRRPQTYEEMLRLWDQMANYELVAAALSEVVEEATQTDDTCPATLWYECNDSRIEDELNDFLKTIGAEDSLNSQHWHVAAFGNTFDKLQYSRGVGVTGMTYVHPAEVRRYWLKNTRIPVGFRWLGNPANHERAFTGPTGAPIQRAALSGPNKAGQSSLEELWYPWDFMHCRRLGRHRGTEHGEPLYDDAQGIYTKMKMALDQLVIYRAQIQPDRYVINVDVGNQTPTEQMKTIHKWQQMFRKKQSFGRDGIGDYKSIYNPMALDTVLYVARSEGMNHTVDKLPGTTAVPDIYDVELLQNLLFSTMGMPMWWIANKDSNNPPSGKALLASDMRFLRKVKSVRKPIIRGYEWLAYFHLLLRGHNIENYEIKAKMSNIGGLEEQQRLEGLEKQVNILAGLADVMEAFKLPREAWLDVVFKKYMNLPEEVVNVFMTALPPSQESQEIGESKGKRRRASTKVILDAIDKEVQRNPDLRREMQAFAATRIGRRDAAKARLAPFRNVGDVFALPKLDEAKLAELWKEKPLMEGKNKVGIILVPKGEEAISESKVPALLAHGNTETTEPPIVESTESFRQARPKKWRKSYR